MAKSNAVWGLDIGQCALKALRLRPHEEREGQIVADAFDYIEYDKILSQPDAEPVELIADALKTFLSRNEVKNDLVAISVSGQNGLARFIKLPPVEQKKIPDIVKYEAKQQIPFALEDVIWDYQQLPGSSEEEGFALESEVGLFAMKRDQVFRALQPLRDADIEVDIIQLAPLAIYNYVAYDLLHKQLDEEFDLENPPESIVVLSVGTDTTDLVVTNGFRVWQRSVPLGGNHFTKALSKELKLTFAKAEHLKRNATKAEDPRAIFKAMRPVFNDILSEIQTSIRFFQNVDKKAEISKIICVGNAMKLPGLQRYLSQHLGIDVTDPGGFLRLAGPEVVKNPKFKENHLCFGVSYGLALQGLKASILSTNLLPPEIYTERLIREKKPWAIASVAVLLFAFAFNFGLGHWRAWANVKPDRYKKSFDESDSTERKSSDLKDRETAKLSKFKGLDKNVNQILREAEGRYLWLEMIMAINAPLPRDPDDKIPASLGERNDVHITNFDYRRFDRKSDWLNSKPEVKDARPGTIAQIIKKLNEEMGTTEPIKNPDSEEGEEVDSSDDGPDGEDGNSDDSSGQPSGKNSGWVIQLKGYHYHNIDNTDQGAITLRNRYIKKFKSLILNLPVGKKNAIVGRTPEELGLEDIVPVINKKIFEVPNPLLAHLGLSDDGPPEEINGILHPRKVKKFEFIVHIWWSDIPHSERLKRLNLENGKSNK